MEASLIKFVKDNSFLYDTREESYRNIKAKARKWEELSNDLQMPVEKLKQRWKSLRDCYNRKKRQIKSGALKDEYGIEKSQVEWKYFDSLSFLDDAPERNISSQFSKIQNSTISKTEEPLGWEKDEDSLSTIDFAIPKIPFVEEFVQSFEAGTIDEEYPEENTTNGARDDFVAEKQENVDSLFGRMLLAYIKTLSHVNHMKVKREIFEVLEKYIEMEEKLQNHEAHVP